MKGALLALVLAATATGGAAGGRGGPTPPGGSTPPAAAPTETLPRKDVPPLVKSVFEKNFRFCTDPAFPLTADELKWCALVSKEDPRCPALAKACHRGEAKVCS